RRERRERSSLRLRIQVRDEGRALRPVSPGSLGRVEESFVELDGARLAGPKQILLVLEVVINDAPGRAELGGDILERHALDASLVEQSRRDRRNLFDAHVRAALAVEARDLQPAKCGDVERTAQPLAWIGCRPLAKKVADG